MRKITIEIIPEVEETAYANCSDEDIINDFFGQALKGYKWKVLPKQVLATNPVCVHPYDKIIQNEMGLRCTGCNSHLGELK